MRKSDKIAIILLFISINLTLIFIVNQMFIYQIGMVSTTQSMNPTLTGYDIIISDNQFDYDKLKKNDIVNMKYSCSENSKPTDNDILNKIIKIGNKFHNTNYLTHRIVNENEKGYITKGDNNNYIDQKTECVNYLTKDNYEGKVIKSYELTKYEFMLISIFILSIPFFIIVYILFSVLYEIKRNFS